MPFSRILCNLFVFVFVCLQAALEAEPERGAARSQHIDRVLKQRERALDQAVKDMDTKSKVRTHIN